MQPFTSHRGKVALLNWTDVNTDLIIPARYLKRIERTGYGPLLFADKRYLPGEAPPVEDPEKPGRPDPAFPWNDPRFAGSSILVVGRNFGCGSSREHAVWAVAQAGYRVLIGPGQNEGFADIFEQNAFNNGLLPIELPQAEWKAIASAVETEAPIEATVDLENQKITLHTGKQPPIEVSFHTPAETRKRLLAGLDAIAETLQQSDAIAQHEARAPVWVAAHASK